MLGKLEPANAQKASAALVAAIGKTTDPYTLRALAEGLTAVPGKVEPADAQKAYTALVAAIEKTTDPDALRAGGGPDGGVGQARTRQRAKGIRGARRRHRENHRSLHTPRVGGGPDGGAGQGRTRRRTKGVHGARRRHRENHRYRRTPRWRRA